MSDSRVKTWFLAARPKTLPAGIAPVLIGTAMAYDAGAFHWPSALCALVGAVLIQVGANYANDYFDFVKGADTGDRLGPARATQAGLVSPMAMRNATLLIFALSILPGAYIVYRGGWPYVVIGLLSILFGVLYTAGPYPLGYVGLGDLFVLIFFGPVAVCGTYYLQTRSFPLDVMVAGFAPGFLSVAVLTVNNLRDIDQDRRAGKKTLAVRFGRTFARAEYVACIVLGACVVPLYLFFTTYHDLLFAAPFCVLVGGENVIKVVLKRSDGPELNGALAGTGMLSLMFAIVFSLGWVL